MLPGERGWVDRRKHVEDPDEWGKTFSRWPSVFRIFAREDPENFPDLKEGKAIKAIRALFNELDVRRDRRLDRAPDFKPDTQDLMDYMLSDEGHRLRSWWRRTAWKSPYRMNGIRAIFAEHLWGIDISLWELAHFRTPAALCYDSEVIAFLAFCQGLDPRDYSTLVDTDSPHRSGLMDLDRRHNGARKLFCDPWFRFSLVAPFLTQYGTFFPGSTIFDSMARMECILSSPYIATHRELEFLASTPMYQAAFSKMVHTRRRRLSSHNPTPIQPMGRWFFGGLAWNPTSGRLQDHRLWAHPALRPEPVRTPFSPRTFDVE